ncbi:MAG: type II toxin-antitoxin system RelE/ParE family toxin [Flavobacteriales bacterium]
MDLEFNNIELADLYQGKKVKNKLYKSNPTLVKQYIKTIKFLEQAAKIEQLLHLKGLHYEKLIDDRVGQSAVRINAQYRLIFIEKFDDSIPPKVVLLSIEEITDYH